MTNFRSLGFPGKSCLVKANWLPLGKSQQNLAAGPSFAPTPVLSPPLHFPRLQVTCRQAQVSFQVFDHVEPDVPCDNVYACVEAAHPFAPDIVIGLGGGSCIDMAKCASLILTHGGLLENYYGEFKIPSRVLPIIAVPTTAGTGSEVTPVAVVSDFKPRSQGGHSEPSPSALRRHL